MQPVPPSRDLVLHGELWETSVNGGVNRPRVRGHPGSGKGSQVCAVTVGLEIHSRVREVQLLKPASPRTLPL